jgi:hypothetical protein
VGGGGGGGGGRLTLEVSPKRRAIFGASDWSSN